MKEARTGLRAAITILAAGLGLVLVLHFVSRRAAPTEPPVETAPPAAQAAAAPAEESAPPNSAALEETAASRAPVAIPLTPILIEAENGSWLRDKPYLEVPRGTRTLGGIEFRLEGMLQLQGKGSETRGRKYRGTIELPLAQAGITNGRFGSLHLLGGTRYETEPGAAVADVVWRYLDGTSRRAALVYLDHIREWARSPFEEPARLPYPFAKVVWRAEDPTQAGRWLRLYRVTLANPDPAKPILGIDLVSAHGAATLFVVAATLDPLAPGVRPDDSPDLEPSDSVAPARLNLFVRTPEGQPLPRAKVRAQARQQGSRRNTWTSQLVADDAGAARIAYPPTDIDQLEIDASAEDYSGRKMVWDAKAGDVIPASYVLKLSASVNIGGSVVDESDSPIPGVKLSFHRFWQGGEQMNQKGEQAELGTREVVTDAQGVWQARGLPPDLLDHIGFDVTHPDYLETNLTVGANAAIEERLRAGTFKIVLHGGLRVRGRVTDETENAVSGALVWAGRRFYRDRQETKSDAQGRFAFRNIAQGDVLFSVMANGRAPESKTFTVRPGMEEILFKLGPGKSIRALVRDEAAQPVAGVRVVLEGEGDIGRTYEFSTETGADGRFEWNAAPAEPMQFYFGKEGYASLRNKVLKPDIDNVVTLRKPRQIQGLVLDADSGQAVTRFRVGTGRFLGTDNFAVDYPGMKDYADPNGQFTVALDEEERDGIRVAADDYSDLTQRLAEEQDGVIPMQIRLKPGTSLRGKVVGPDGTPAPGAQVALVKDGFGGGITLRNGRLQTYGGDAHVVVADPSGQFALSSPPETGGRVAAAGEGGFGMATVEQVRASGVVVVQPYGQIEGDFKIAGAPAVGREILFSLGVNGISTDWESFKTATDEQGKFKFAKVPAGDGEIVRLIKTAPNSWAHSHNTAVTVEPGKTTFVSLGDSGAVIRGRVRFAQPPADVEKLVLSGSLRSAPPTPPAFGSQAEAEAYLDSPEGMARMKLSKHFSLAVEADGSFVIDSIPGGDYSLNISAARADKADRPWQTKTVASGATAVSVPDPPNPASPLDVGEILLSPAPDGQ